MFHSHRPRTLAICVALTLMVTALPAGAAPSQEGTEVGLAWLAQAAARLLDALGVRGVWPQELVAKEGSGIDPIGGSSAAPSAPPMPTEKEGSGIDPDGVRSAGVCGDAGSGIDPNGGPCGT